MCVSQINPVTQLGLSSQLVNIKFWNVQTALRAKFPFLLPAVVVSLKSCRPCCSDLSRTRAFHCYLLFPFHMGRKNSLKTTACQRPIQRAEKNLLQLGLCPQILGGLQLGRKKSPRTKTHPLSQFIVIWSMSSWPRLMNNHSYLEYLPVLSRRVAMPTEGCDFWWWAAETAAAELTFIQDWLLLWFNSSDAGKL